MPKQNEVKQILLGLHDDIIAIWEKGRQYEDNYPEQVDKITNNALESLAKWIEGEKKQASDTYAIGWDNALEVLARKVRG